MLVAELHHLDLNAITSLLLFSFRQYILNLLNLDLAPD